MKVGEFCIRDVVYVEPTASLFSVAEKMRHRHVGSVIVAEQDGAGKALGIITDRDLVIEVLAARLDPDQVAAEDIMSFNLTLAREEDDLWDAVHRMQEHSVRRMPVVDQEERLVGIISLDDLLRVVARELDGIVSLVHRERQAEANLRV